MRHVRPIDLQTCQVMRGIDSRNRPLDMLYNAFQCHPLLFAFLRIVVIPTIQFIFNTPLPLRFVHAIAFFPSPSLRHSQPPNPPFQRRQKIKTRRTDKSRSNWGYVMLPLPPSPPPTSTLLAFLPHPCPFNISILAQLLLCMCCSISLFLLSCHASDLWIPRVTSQSGRPVCGTGGVKCLGNHEDESQHMQCSYLVTYRSGRSSKARIPLYVLLHFSLPAVLSCVRFVDSTCHFSVRETCLWHWWGEVLGKPRRRKPTHAMQLLGNISVWSIVEGENTCWGSMYIYSNEVCRHRRNRGAGGPLSTSILMPQFNTSSMSVTFSLYHYRCSQELTLAVYRSV
uniref:Leucine-rich repeat protein kinase family protein n=1 Tax=Echinococcus granulosus TaxID=6210 RepID=A0A068WX44_ECHGR|nr:hypothetical protein EgrG_002049400 [Echinococcus granulosus]